MFLAHPNSLRKRRSGMALLAVMVVIMLVALAAYGFNQRMMDAYRVSQTQVERAQAQLAATSAIEILLAEVEQPRAMRRFAQRPPTQPSSTGTSVLAGQAIESEGVETTDETIDGWKFSVLAPEAGDPESRTVATEESPSAWRFGVVNESAKLNLLALNQWERQFPGHARTALMQLPDAEEPLVEAFIEAYSIGHPGGAMALDRGAEILQNIRESRDTRGTQPGEMARLWAQRWCGGDWNCDYRVDPLEAAIMEAAESPGTATSSLDAAAENMAVPIAWRDYLTFHSGERNENRMGRERVFLNDADLSRLHRRLLAIWPESWANFAIAVRQFGLAGSGGGASSGASSGWTPDFSRSASYLIKSPLDLIGASVTVLGTDGDSIRLSSPLRPDAEAMRDYLGSLVDDVTVDANRVLVGQIDVLDAPAQVLGAIPGISQETVAAILQRRSSAPPDGSSRQTVAWLVLEQAIDLPAFKQLYPWITVGGDCYSAQVVGFRDSVTPLFRCTVVLDGRTRPARIRNQQQWHMWGRGFSTAALLDASESLVGAHQPSASEMGRAPEED